LQWYLVGRSISSYQTHVSIDISLIPTEDLPVQAVLNFQPCGASLAAAYLQSLCLAEGYSVQRNSVLQLYISSPGVEPGDGLLPSVPSNGGVPDLRKTINHLQFRCSSTDFKTEHGDKPLPTDSIDDLWGWRQSVTPSMNEKTSPAVIASHTELLSFLDSHLMRSVWNTPAVGVSKEGIEYSRH